MKKRYKGIGFDLYGTLLVQDLGFAVFADICSPCVSDPARLTGC